MTPAQPFPGSHPQSPLETPPVVCAGAALMALAVYIRTLQPSLPTGDSGELITVAYLLGVAHPPGYPLFSMVGHLFTLLPFGSPAYRVNLMSAVFGAATIGVVAMAVWRLVVPNMPPRSPRWAALAGATVGGLSLAFSIAFWRYSIVAEVFALNSLFAALIMLVLLEWERRPERLRLLWMFALLSGLASTNQQTIALLAPSCLVLLVSGARQVIVREMSANTLVRYAAVALVLFVVGLVPYAYLPLAAAHDPALNWGDPQTPAALWRLMTRADYGTFNLVPNDRAPISAAPQQVLVLLRDLYDGFTPLGCVLAVVGAWWLWRRHRAASVALVLAFLISGPAFVAYANPKVDNAVLYGVLERFYILPSTFVAIGIGAGVAAVMGWASQAQVMSRRPLAGAALGALLLAVPLGAMVVHYRDVDQSGNVVDRNFGYDLLAPLEHDALFLVTGDVATMAVDYLQQVEGDRTDVVALSMEKLKSGAYVQQVHRQHPDVAIPFATYAPGGDALARLVEANLPSRPVYVLGKTQDSGFSDHFDTQRAGFATKLLPKSSGADPYAVVESHLDLFRNAHYPAPVFADTTFEADIVRGYGALAFDVAYVLDDGVRDAEAIPFYRLSLKLDPGYAPADKNLGLVLYRHDGATAEVASLWEEYLRLSPNDPETPAIRQRLSALGR